MWENRKSIKNGYAIEVSVNSPRNDVINVALIDATGMTSAGLNCLAFILSFLAASVHVYVAATG